METLTIDHKNGHKSEYKLLLDQNNLPIAYHLETNDKVVNTLEYARKNNIRIVVDLGDTKTGESWNEEYAISGYVGLSRGTKARFPILVYNNRSSGGGGLLDHCIIGIYTSKGKKPLYQFNQ